MDDPLVPFRWLDRSIDILGEIYCVSFFRGLAPTEVLRRFGPAGATGEEMTLDVLRDVVEDFVEANQAEGGHVGVVQAYGWSVALELDGWHAITRYSELSRGCEMLAIMRHDYAEDTLVYAVDGKLITRIVPIPGIPQGKDPGRLGQALDKVGMPTEFSEYGDDDWEAVTDRLSRDRFPLAFALAAEVTGVPFTEDLLTFPLLVGALDQETPSQAG